MDKMLADGFLIIIITLCLWTDLREKKIYNKVTFPALLIAFFLNIYFQGLAGAWFSLKGLVLGMALILLPFVLGGIGAGDVKLLMVIGALKGPAFIFYATMATFIMGGLVAVVMLMFKKALFSTLKNLLFNLIVGFFGKTGFKIKGNIHSANTLTFPYGIAIFGGTLITLMVV